MYHHATLHALSELLAAAGLEHPQQLRPIHFSKRTSTTEVMSFAKLYPSLRPGELIEGTSDPRFRDAWAMARAGFVPAGGIKILAVFHALLSLGRDGFLVRSSGAVSAGMEPSRKR